MDAIEKITGNVTPNFESKYNVDSMIKNGFIAQEVQNAAIASNYTAFSGVDQGNENTLWGLRTGDLIPAIVKSIQELKFENEQLKSENNQLKLRITSLEQRLN